MLADRGARRARHGLIVAEIALAVMLALGAGVLLRSFLNLQRVNTGVDAATVVTMRLTLPQEQYRTGEAITAFFEELARRVDALPNVARAVSPLHQGPPPPADDGENSAEDCKDAPQELRLTVGAICRRHGSLLIEPPQARPSEGRRRVVPTAAGRALKSARQDR